MYKQRLTDASQITLLGRFEFSKTGATAGSASQKSTLMPLFMTIYFQHFTVIDARLIYAEVGWHVRRCAGGEP